ncbi:MAG: gamma-glutamylcyclotransferase [bacterium]|nr:gamma-glutamylcyclotransferase [bacterium]
MSQDLLFVYGTLRPGFDGPMAAWLRGAARPVGPAWIGGALYRVADYPGFVPGAAGHVAGDLFALADPATVLPILDAHEECSDAFPEPHEYRRERLIVETAEGPVAAWTYVYARDVSALERIEGGDFLA